MFKALGLIAVASTSVFALTCLSLSGLDQDSLEAADERAFESAAAMGSNTVHLVSTGVARGYLSALSLLAASAVASTGALVVSQNRCCNVIGRLLVRLIASLAFLALICGIILMGLAASAKAAGEMPNWCAPKSATRATAPFMGPFGFTGDPTTFGSVPLAYVYNEESGATRPLSGSELSHPGGGGVGLGGEFTGSGRVVDAYGQSCFAINTGVTSFWHDALARAALPSALVLILLLVAYFALLNEDTSTWDEIRDLCWPSARMQTTAENKKVERVEKANLSRRASLINLPKHSHSYHPVACGFPLAPFLEQAGLSAGGVNIILRTGAATTAIAEALPPPSIFNPSSVILGVGSVSSSSSSSSSNCSVQEEGSHSNGHHSVALVEDLALDKRLSSWYESIVSTNHNAHSPVTSSASPLVILQALAVAWPALASLTASDAAKFLVAVETARELHRWLGLRNMKFQERDIVDGARARRLAAQAANPIISKMGVVSTSERTTKDEHATAPSYKSAGVGDVAHPNSEEDKERHLAALYGPTNSHHVPSSTSGATSSPAHSVGQTTGTVAEHLPNAPQITTIITTSTTSSRAKQRPALPPRTNSPRPQPPPPSSTAGVAVSIPEAWLPPASPFLRRPPVLLPEENSNAPNASSAVVESSASAVASSDAAMAPPPSTTFSAPSTPPPLFARTPSAAAVATAAATAASTAASTAAPFFASPVDRSAATYYAVRVAAGGKKSCRVAWTPPPADPRFFADTGGERRFSVVSKALSLLRVGKPEVLTCPAAAASADPQRPKPMDIRFFVLGPEAAPDGGSVLEALAEVYEHRPGGGRAAVDLLEFTIQVMNGHEI